MLPLAPAAWKKGALVDLEVFNKRLSMLESVLADLRRLATLPRETFLQDRGLQAQAERWLHLAAEAALDIAHHLIADRGFRSPSTYREAFQVLKENGILDDALAVDMMGWAGLRNVLVHLYLDVDHAKLHEILTGDLDQLERYSVAVARAASA
jgi:uncharacterized protein YutE (UPF0331/DUF86 family)